MACRGRLRSELRSGAVEVSVYHGLAAVMHRSTDYQPCTVTGSAPKSSTPSWRPLPTAATTEAARSPSRASPVPTPVG